VTCNALTYNSFGQAHCAFSMIFSPTRPNFVGLFAVLRPGPFFWVAARKKCINDLFLPAKDLPLRRAAWRIGLGYSLTFFGRHFLVAATWSLSILLSFGRSLSLPSAMKKMAGILVHVNLQGLGLHST
ncbi:hypothetical protein ACFQ1M_17675, partial [Sungkyunkwania multivorans]